MKHNKHWLGNLMLFTATLIWGTSFIVMKNTLDAVPVYGLLAIRFSIASALIALINWKKLRHINPKLLWDGAVCGILLVTAYILQTFGLTDTTAGKNAFLTAVYCVLTPFIGWLCFHKRLHMHNWVAAGLCFAGIGLVSLDGNLSISMGDALSLSSGVFFAAHIVALNYYGQKGDDPVLLTILQLAASALIAGFLSLRTETGLNALPAQAWGSLLYLAVMCTAVTLFFQTKGLSLTDATSGGLILSLESVFGVLFSVLAGAEHLTVRMIFGFAVIFGSILLNEMPSHDEKQSIEATKA